ATECVRRDHISAIGDMSAASAIVGAQVISSNNPVRILRHKHGVSGRMPVGKRIGSRNIARNGVGLAGAKSRLQDTPDGISVLRPGLPDQHAVDQLAARLIMTRSIWPVKVCNFSTEIGTARPSLSSSNGRNPAARSRSIMSCADNPPALLRSGEYP